MAWFKDKKEEDNLPASLKGKTPEEIAKALEEAEQLRTQVAKSAEDQKKLNEALESQKSEFEKVKTQLSALESVNRRTNEDSNNEEVNFFEDPDKAVDKKLQPLAQITALNASQTARILAQQHLDNNDFASPEGARTMDGRLFRAWAAEIDAEAKKYPVQNLTQPQAWLGIYMFLKGVHADELANPEIRKKKYNFVESARTNAAPAVESGNSDKLTDQEAAIAVKMGVTPEAYLKRKKSMQFYAA